MISIAENSAFEGRSSPILGSFFFHWPCFPITVVHSELASGRRYIYHDLDGISYVRKTTSRQVQWGRVPRVVFEVRTPGEMPMYLIGDRWGGEYVYELPENFPPPGHIVGL